MPEQQHTHPFVHCNVPMTLSEREKHPRIPLHETKTFTCSVCNASMTVTAPIVVTKQDGSA